MRRDNRAWQRRRIEFKDEHRRSTMSNKSKHNAQNRANKAKKIERHWSENTHELDGNIRISRQREATMLRRARQYCWWGWRQQQRQRQLTIDNRRRRRQRPTNVIAATFKTTEEKWKLFKFNQFKFIPMVFKRSKVIFLFLSVLITTK